jgi:GTP-binding protein
MKVNTAEFVMSNQDITKCPIPQIPEYAFIGRSNVGKSSLINMLANVKNLAKISGKPGKTRLINHFIMNKSWYLVDLPGYGFAKASKTHRNKYEKFINEYMLKRENLMNVFLLIDSRHPPQFIDIDFMEWLGTSGIAFSIVFTKIDKLNRSQQGSFYAAYEAEMLKTWEEMPPHFITSSETKHGRDEVLNYIEEINASFVKP